MTGKWLAANVTDDIPAVIAAMFDEAERRDPAHERTWVALVDGNRQQIDTIRDQAAARGVTVTIVIDFVHVLEYLSAPRGALLYPRRSGERSEGSSLGPMAYLDPKGEGDNSMPGNRRPGPGVRDGALGDPRDMAKAGLPEAQSPEDASRHPPERRLKPVPRPASGIHRCRRNLRDAERCPVRVFKEMSGPPKSR